MPSLDGINGPSIQTLLRGENDSKQSDKFQATHPRKFGNHVTDRPSDRPSVRTTDNQCLLSHFLATLGAQEEADCTSMLSSIDSSQNRVSADQYHQPVSRAQVSTHQGRVFFWSYPLTIYSFSNDYRLTFTFFFKFISNMLCLCQYRPALLRFWFQTDLRRKNSAIFFLNTCEEDLFLPWSRVGHAPRPIFMLWLVKIWQVSSCVKFMQHLESCLLWQLKLTEFWVNLWCF